MSDAQYRHLETELTEPPDLGLVGVEAKEGEAGELVDTLLWVGVETLHYGKVVTFGCKSNHKVVNFGK